jgi:sugar transferase (PEP-CTERM/EpsH1 system associated)
MMDEILFLSHRVPWPPDRGDKIRSYHILNHLRLMAPVHVAAFADNNRDLGFAKAMDVRIASSHVEMRDKPVWLAGAQALLSERPVSLSSFASQSMSHWVNALLASRPISHIYCFSGQMAQYVPTDFAGRLLMDFVDVDSAKFESYSAGGNAAMRWVNAREGRLLGASERQAAARADYSLFVSESEADLFRSRTGAENVRVLGNGIDSTYYDPNAKIQTLQRQSACPLIVFTGQMDYRPNVEAVTEFARNALPVIRAVHINARFAIVGRNPTAAVSKLSALPGVQVIGAVDDVRPWLAAADVVVAPLRTARGIQNKILEAMAMAKPVVASPAAAEGISAQPGMHFYIEDNPAEQARRVCLLLGDASTRQKVGDTARAQMVSEYGWEQMLAPLYEMMQGRPARTAEAKP